MTTQLHGDGGVLRATAFLDHASPEVRDFVADALPASATSPRAQAVALYYAVRDRVRYEVYGADLSRAGLRASSVARTGSGMCLHKSVLYAAGLRSLGVPARLVLGDVRNHLASERLKRLIGGDVFHMHCLTSVRLDGRWVRATPVFNKALCRLYGLAPLDFDGTADSLHHPFDLQGRRHMEFLRSHGEFDDLPYERVIGELKTVHPRLFSADGTRFTEGSLAGEAAPLTAER
ncbi:transglutaminase-like domain-containing protein [Streptomyces sp. LP11]|uniref:Transglutaminase-like domain-containing protein n=1 Tax=Streptomyces pyxinicus TaxID=2970331 RepID=A0ABT2B1I6_9ACTN|nr:transglutaminase-like domain-containing protein [Streptomyces sp. LP11]MCS0602266.1 transglutaminase-like domain-containing protein [Streptomyces sp. LP11]